MLLLHVLLLFVLFSSSAATGQDGQPQNEGSSSSRPQTGSEIQLGGIYWLPLTHFGAEGPRSSETYPVVPVGRVPLEYTDNVDHGIYFVADLWHTLSLEGEYTEVAKAYFYKQDKIILDTRKELGDLAKMWVNLGRQSINTGWARIAKGEALELQPSKVIGQIRNSDGMTKIYNRLLRNFEERINSGSLKLNLAVDGLGQTFEPYIEFGALYWLEPMYLGSPNTPGSKRPHPVFPVGRMDTKTPGRDLIFLTQLSGYLPLQEKYQAEAEPYLDAASGEKYRTNKMNIGWAQVALSVTFCYGRHRDQRDGSYAHLKVDKMDEIRRTMQENYNERINNRLELNFNVDNLKQYNRAAFVTLGNDNVDCSVGLRILGSIENSVRIRHYVVPVGKRDTKNGDRYFVAELSNTRPSWGQYWEKAAKYFSQEKIEIETGRGSEVVIVPKEWWINTSWAVSVAKDQLHRILGGGRDAGIGEKWVEKIYSSIQKNYNKRLEKGKTEFSFRIQPVVDGQARKLPARPSGKNGESSKSER